MNSIQLMGAEDVRRAGYQMAEAARLMSQAAGEIDAALQRHRQWAEDWLMRLQDTMKEKEVKIVTEGGASVEGLSRVLGLDPPIDGPGTF